MKVCTAGTMYRTPCTTQQVQGTGPLLLPLNTRTAPSSCRGMLDGVLEPNTIGVKARDAKQLYMQSEGIALHLNHACKKTNVKQMWDYKHTQDHYKPKLELV